MRKLRNIIVIILIASALWHFYGDNFKQSGIDGVYQEMSSDLEKVKQNPTVVSVVNYVSDGIQLLIDKGQEKIGDNPQTNRVIPDKPELNLPSEQSFSVHNIEIGDLRSEVEQQVGQPKRSSLNEYGVEWVTYHENYYNFLMAAYNAEDQVVGLYTNQDLVTSKEGISLNSTRDSVRSLLNEPLEYLQRGLVRYQIQSKDEYDVFQMDNSFVTIFYDKHENSTVTAIQMISEELEKQRKDYFTEPSDGLKKGLEYQLFDLTNATRVNHGLSVLSWDELVRTTARDHSIDMAENNFFSHTNLAGQSPFDRMTEDNIDYRMAGENLAFGQPSSIFAHEGLMNSIGHRENKLQNDFEFLSVGVAFNEDSQPYYTENFLTK
ncbi:CAP domain-containing protein [Aquibacillus koreensis]|uniref:CAP domain-containing protein n=1 Tax=Aquibacillus koreensis TaxID=279446 RepID=A0A9X3WJU7_9BACI|nr:CAP domain-containing protein [Aquibacillus koreensis]MCT2535166.1 CAP domain-containing protein [Aquibacillus koreensis]MDC3421025.1 CAP domain-containing protein [Aquibacillus koreensis]